MKMYELIPTNGRKSFCGKAKVVIDDNGGETLFSYDTPIMRRDPDGTLTRLWHGWTTATGAHIKSFCGLGKSEFMAL